MASGERTLIIIRHGETNWNRIGRLQGQRDTPLNDTGREQARRNGTALGRYLSSVDMTPEDFTWFSSPLSRTRETLDLVLENLPAKDIPYRFDDRLKEFTFGDWEGQVLSDLKRTVPDAYRARRADKWHFQPPNGESYQMLRDRVSPWLDETSGNLIAVTHGGVIRVLWHLLEQRAKEQVTEEVVRQDRIYVFRNGQPSFV